MKKIIIFLFLIFFSLNIIYANDIKDFAKWIWDSISDQMNWEWLKNQMIVWEKKTSIFWSNNQDNVDLDLWANSRDVNFEDNFIKVIERYIFGLLWIIAVGVFLYIGFILFTAEWKEEKLKEWMKALVYAWVWLAIIPLSYILIKIVTWLNF